MKYGKIRIEDGYLIFTKHMMMNNLPCRDILWAYMRREGMDGVEERQLISNYLVIVTRRRKRYKFDMTEREVQEGIRLLKVLNPGIWGRSLQKMSAIFFREDFCEAGICIIFLWQIRRRSVRNTV